jgi:hypothetical protein
MGDQQRISTDDSGPIEPSAVIITPQLRERPVRAVHHAAEAAAMQRLSDTMAIEPKRVF